ncbi:hypothetical protein ABZ371_02985 [Streptomyces sp. NPDC005899]|uniref:hypothetical protein n=1 Tax=Streptomyces sp. NPDC005899 TaxID=3155716 RepID=UPI0033FB5208
MVNRPGSVRALLLTVAAAVLLTGCTEAAPEAAPPGATQSPSSPSPSPSPTPSPTVTPTPSTAAERADAVRLWYEFGGGTAMTSLIGETVKARAGRPTEEFDSVTADFEALFEALRTARLFGTIPDAQAQTAWAAALENLEAGAQQVLASVSGTTVILSPQESGQMWAGWATFDKGVSSLKATGTRLDRAFGLKPASDPWKQN